MSKDDLDLFILHAYSHVLAYQKELQKIHVEGETRLRRAIDALKGDDHNEAVKSQLEYQLEKEKQVLSLDNQKKFFKIQAESEAKLRKQLKHQAEAHADHLTDAVTEKEKELRRIFNRELNEKLSVEQAAYKLQLATTIGKLKGMDSALKGTFFDSFVVFRSSKLPFVTNIFNNHTHFIIVSKHLHTDSHIHRIISLIIIPFDSCVQRSMKSSKVTITLCV